MATPTKPFPRIKEVKAYVAVPAPKAADKFEGGADCHDVADDHWINGNLGFNGECMPIANPMSVWEQYKAHRTSWGIAAMGSFICEIEADDGTTGVGISIGGDAACFIVEKHLSRFVEGEDPRNVEAVWDKMWRGSVNYGRKGLTIQALSAVDLALWDLLGKLRNEPVWALLGGKTKERLPVYTTTARPDLGKALGFVGTKVPLPYGPAEGDAGLRKNVAWIKECREKVGPDFALMVDCYMALTVPYAIKLGKELEKLGVKWMEEFLPPDEYAGYKEVKQALCSLDLMLTTGEHEYTRYGFRQLLENRLVDIIQPDISWLGGITEARRVVAMASAFDVLCVPHGSSIYSYHLQYAFCNCPLAEFINLSPKAYKIEPYFGTLFKDEPLPKDGFIDLPDRPGFGVTLDHEGNNFKRPYERTAEEVRAQYTANATRPAPTVPHMPI